MYGMYLGPGLTATNECIVVAFYLLKVYGTEGWMALVFFELLFELIKMFVDIMFAGLLLRTYLPYLLRGGRLLSVLLLALILLRSRGLPVTGTQAVLLDRLMGAMPAPGDE